MHERRSNSPVKSHSIQDGRVGGEAQNIGRRPVLGDQASGGTGLCKGHDGTGFDGSGDMVGGIADGFRKGKWLGFRKSVDVTSALDLFNLVNDLGHHGNRLNRVLAACRLSRQHDGVGSIQYGVGHVRGLGPCRSRVVDHRFQHLGGGDDHLPSLVGFGNDVFLNHRNLLRSHFHSKISAGHHHPFTDIHDGIQVCDGHRLFQFGDHRCVPFSLGKPFLQLEDIGGSSNE